MKKLGFWPESADRVEPISAPLVWNSKNTERGGQEIRLLGSVQDWVFTAVCSHEKENN